MENFSNIVGFKYLSALHINDSKAPLGSNRDMHANIGTGYLGLEAFRILVNDERLAGLPMVLETPLGPENDTQVWAGEIKLLESLIGVEADDKRISKLSEDLQSRGEAERKRVGDQVDKKETKKVKKTAVGKPKVADRGKMPKPDGESESEAVCSH
jgi:AP endonuclease-1